MTEPYLVGITGGSASGKSYFIDQLLSRIDNNSICLVSQDHYYRSRDAQPLDEKGVKNFDLPESIDLDLFAEDIKKLKSGQQVEKQEYVYNNPEKKPRTLLFEPAPIIVIEGLFVFYAKEIYNSLDLKIFIDAKEHIKLKRRIRRDNDERGYDLDDVLYRFEKHVIPTFERYILPYKDEADIIIPNNNDFKQGLDVICSFLENKAKTM
jgi:uridine kinase